MGWLLELLAALFVGRALRPKPCCVCGQPVAPGTVFSCLCSRDLYCHSCYMDHVATCELAIQDYLDHGNVGPEEAAALRESLRHINGPSE